METSHELERAAMNEMQADENLLWVGYPDPKRFAMQSLPIFLMGILWTAFAIGLTVVAGFGAMRAHESGSSRLFLWLGLLFVLIGFFLLSSPYLLWRRAQRTVYAISNRRALIITAGRKRDIQAYDRRNIGDIQRKERANGIGDVLFARRVDMDSEGMRAATSFGFFGIPDAQSVEKMIRDLAGRDS